MSSRNLPRIGAVALSLIVVGIVAANAAAAPIGAYTTQGAWSFASEPNLHPPKLHNDVPTQSKKLSPGYFMIANFPNLFFNKELTGQGGPLILDHRLQPVWFDPVPTNQYAGNLRAQTYNGKPVLSWWEGVIANTGATTEGKYEVVNQQYRTVATLAGADGWVLSLHEFLIRGRDAWVTAYKNEPMDLTPYGGAPNGILTHSAVQEYDLRSGKLLYSWDASAPGRIGLTESEVRAVPGVAWDADHVNAISLVGAHEFLVSMRNDWAAYLVDVKTGKILWRLGGKQSSFKLAANAQFQWQHDVEMHPGNEVSLFDNNCCALAGPGKLAAPTGPSRAMVLKLNPVSHAASLLAQYRHHGLEVGTQGDAQLLPNGNVMVGWGQQPWLSEYSKSAQLLFDATLPTPDESYRTYSSPWTGTPWFPPSGAVRKVKGKTMVYASWDGATEVAQWKVLAGSTAKHLATVAAKIKSGFETTITLNRSYKLYRLQALDSGGHLLRTSKQFSLPSSQQSNPPPSGFY